MRRHIRSRVTLANASRGQVIIMVAVFAVSLVGMIGLSIDLGYAFAERRTVQNAADSAALAGAHALTKWSVDNPNYSAQGDVAAMVNDNKMGTSTTQSYSCSYVDDQNKVLASCAVPVPADATGIHVEVHETHPTFFIRVIPGAPKTVSTSASATAHVQAVTTGVGSDSPFILCGAGAYLASGGSMSVLTNGSADAAPTNVPLKGQVLTYPVGSGSGYQVEFLKKKTTPTPTTEPSPTPVGSATSTAGSGGTGTSTYSINPAAYGQTFILHAPQVAGCDTQGNRFKGDANNTANYGKAIPGLFDYAHGDKAGPTRAAVAGINGCSSGFTRDSTTTCVLLVPIASGSTNDELNVQTVGAFLVWGGSNYNYGTLLSSYQISTPPGLGPWTGSNGWKPGKGGLLTERLTK